MSVASTTVAICVVLAAALVSGTVIRRRLRRGAVSGADVAASQRRYLASNWSEVEAAALRGGMSSDEIAAVRRKLLGG